MSKIIFNGVDYAGGSGNYFNPVIYSDTERKIGVWRDNKPLYEKTINFGALPNNESKKVNHNIANIDRIWVYDGYAFNSNSGYVNQLNLSGTSNISSQWYCGCNSTFVEVRPNSDRTAYDECFIVVRYTKTTDVAGSGDYNTLGVPTVHYSTSEQVIGTWIDGKPLYQKTINITTPSVANAIVSVSDVTSLNIDTVVSLDGNYNDTNINWSLNIYFNTGRSANCFVNGGKTAIMMLVNDNVAMNKNAYVTIKYTKTTD